MLTNLPEKVYGIRQEEPVGVCDQFAFMGLMAFGAILVLKVIR
jgi:hypothetical protein